ncbi:MAG: energy transducer TonB [Bacteroidales bacterium]|nr:energy transducer TonB [Bacteroidales bacterium]
MKKNFTLLILLAFSFNALFSQQENDFVKAKFNGNIEKYFAKQIKYPRELAARGIEGRTVLSFVITKQGELESIAADEFPHINLAKEPISILKSTKGMWSPTLINNEPVDFIYKIIINYNIQKGQSVSSSRRTFNQERPSPPAPMKEKSLILKDKSLRKVKKEQYDKALSLIDEAIKINPYKSEYYDIRSRVHYSLNNINAAEQDAMSAIKYRKEIMMVLDIVSYSVTRKTIVSSKRTVRRM